MFIIQKECILFVVTSFVMISYGDNYIQSWYFIQHLSISSKLLHHPLCAIFWHKLVIDRGERTNIKKILQNSKPMDKAHIFSKLEKLMKDSFCNLKKLFTRTKTISIAVEINSKITPLSLFTSKIFFDRAIGYLYISIFKKNLMSFH
jgi:hypothetical protein